jgi:uncharacterized BrkB/YihY/UPF0761 family membrane protein
MNNQLNEYLAAFHKRHEARNRRKWQRIRRIGRLPFIILVISGLWLLVVASSFFAVWTLLPAWDAMDHLPPHFYRALLFIAPISTVLLYFTVNYVWRVNERKYADDRNT